MNIIILKNDTIIGVYPEMYIDGDIQFSILILPAPQICGNCIPVARHGNQLLIYWWIPLLYDIY